MAGRARSSLLVILAVAAVPACSLMRRPAAPPPPSPELPISAFAGTGASVRLDRDPVTVAIGRAEAEFEAGRDELAAGRLSAARERFDEAIDLLLAMPGGARTDTRLAAALESLLDRITALEMMMLREADGVAEADVEPAAIDGLLAAAMFEPPQPAETTEETVAADLGRTPHDVPIVLHTKVLSYVEAFQTTLRPFIQEGLDRSRRYLPMVQRIFREVGVPEDLAFVPLVESGFKVNAVSRASARGIWQFMLPTAREHGLTQDWFIDERSDPEKATRAAAEYLRSLNEVFGDWYLALAGYNAGPGRVRRAIDRSRSTDFWQIASSSRYLPRETREYVPMVLAAVIIAGNPALYGFDTNGTAPLTYETVHVPAAIDLRILAEWAEIPVDSLRELNPELRRTTTPNGAHTLKVPIGTAATLQTSIDTADPSVFVRFDFHRVRRGDTLSAIAQRYGIRLADLYAANNLTSSRIRVNQVLTIPSRPRLSLPAPAASASVSDEGPTTYQVRRGDTLISIARRFDTTVADLKRLNSLSSDRIVIGDRLTVRR